MPLAEVSLDRLLQYAASCLLANHDLAFLDEVGPCRCDRGEKKRLAVRKYAGVFLVLLPVHHMIGCEACHRLPMHSRKREKRCQTSTFSATTTHAHWRATVAMRGVAVARLYPEFSLAALSSCPSPTAATALLAWTRIARIACPK